MFSTNFNDSKKLMSDFNEGGFQIYRLHNLWDECNRLSVSGKYQRWKFTLVRIWVELSADADKSDKEKYTKELTLHDKRIELAKGKDQLYYALIKKEEFLKKLQDDVGKGSRRSSQYDEIMI